MNTTPSIIEQRILELISDHTRSEMDMFPGWQSALAQELYELFKEWRRG